MSDVTIAQSKPVNTYQHLLQELGERPLHAARAHPLAKEGKYDELTLSTPILPEMETGVPEVDEMLDSANRQVSGVFKLSAESVYKMFKNGLTGGICGLAIGSLVSLLRFGHGIPDLVAKRYAKGAVYALLLPVMGFVIGGASGAYQSAKSSVDNFADLAKERLQFLGARESEGAV